jgi:hypothetical protein
VDEQRPAPALQLVELDLETGKEEQRRDAEPGEISQLALELFKRLRPA